MVLSSYPFSESCSYVVLFYKHFVSIQDILFFKPGVKQRHLPVSSTLGAETHVKSSVKQEWFQPAPHEQGPLEVLREFRRGNGYLNFQRLGEDFTEKQKWKSNLPRDERYIVKSWNVIYCLQTSVSSLEFDDKIPENIYHGVTYIKVFNKCFKSYFFFLKWFLSYENSYS